MAQSLPAAVAIPVPVITRRVLVNYACFTLVLALVFGGGTRHGALGDGLVELAALPLLAYGILTLRLSDLPRSGRLAVLMALAIVALPLLQLLPLPSVLWSHLPGRAPFAETYRSLGMALPWLPISLDASATAWSLLSLLPALALFLVAIRFTAAEKAKLVKVAIPVLAVSVLLDCLQMMGGADSPLRFYAVTNPDRAVGFFANANHNASLLAAMLPPLIVMFAGGDTLFGSRKAARGTIAFVFVAIFVGLSLTHSRAGLALGLLATVLSIVIAIGNAAPGSRVRIMRYGIGATVVSLLLAFQFGFLALSQRVEKEDLIADLRWPVAAVTFQAATRFVPIGSGLGTFQPVYEMAAPRSLVRPAFVNHAHDDWLELWLEGGVPAAILAGAFLVLYAGLSVAAFGRCRGGDRAGGMAAAASVSIVLFMVHETVDYPLRTVALLVIFAMFAATLLPGRTAPDDGAASPRN